VSAAAIRGAHGVRQSLATSTAPEWYLHAVNRPAREVTHPLARRRAPRLLRAHAPPTCAPIFSPSTTSPFSRWIPRRPSSPSSSSRTLRLPAINSHHHQSAVRGVGEGLPRRAQRPGHCRGSHRALRDLSARRKGATDRPNPDHRRLPGQQCQPRPPSRRRRRPRACRSRSDRAENRLRATGWAPEHR
jgi:hypothetical protein